jgi:hypothetical protein
MTRLTLARIVLASALAAATLPARSALAQCAMCQATLTSSAEGRALAGPLNRAILLLFAAPYLVAGVFALVAFRGPLLRRLAQALPAAWRPRTVHASR